MTTKTPTDPVQAAEAALADAQQARADLLVKIRDGEEVATEDLVAVEKAVDMAEIRLEGAGDRAAAAAEAERQKAAAKLLHDARDAVEADGRDRLAAHLERFVAAADSFLGEWASQTENADQLGTRARSMETLPDDLTMPVGVGLCYQGKPAKPRPADVFLGGMLNLLFKARDIRMDPDIESRFRNSAGLNMGPQTGPFGLVLGPYVTDGIRKALDHG